MEIIVKNNQSLIDVAIEHLGSAFYAVDIALLNGISLTEVLTPGMVLLLPDSTPATSVDTLPTIAPVTEPGLLAMLSAHAAIIGGNTAGHVRNGGNVSVDGAGRMWVTFPEYVTNWDDIENKPSTFSPSTHAHTQHTGTANTVAGFDVAGVAKEYALTDFGGAKRLVVQDTIADTNNLTGMAIKPITNNATKIATCHSGATIIRALNSSASLATLTTANSRLITYCSSIDEFHVICNLAGTIYRIGGTSNALIGSISVNAQTTSDRTAFDTLGNFEYYTSGASGVTLNQRNLTDGSVTTITVGSGITAICCFTQVETNYIGIIQGSAVYIYNESLVLISYQVILNGAGGITLYYNSNKLYASGSISGFGTSIIDTSIITSLTLVENLTRCWKVKGTPNYLITEMQSGFNLNSVGSKNYTLRLHNYSDFQSVDSKYLFPTNYFAIQGLEYDSINDVVISMAVSGGATYYSSLFYLKIK